ncbi:unnamed protein product [marine sediment metagenome]|uniref:Uncharacterized protein n=1 Tax=marine sediment metagenome TaxID=412755 RepID=X1RLS7_9ZZZZ
MIIKRFKYLFFSDKSMFTPGIEARRLAFLKQKSEIIARLKKATHKFEL